MTVMPFAPKGRKHSAVTARKPRRSESVLPSMDVSPFGPYNKRLYSQDTQKVQNKFDILNVSSTEKDKDRSYSR